MSTRASIQSFTARLLNARDQMSFEEMPDDELRSTLEEAMRLNRSLTLENEVLERFLLRKDPQSLHKFSTVVDSARQAQKILGLHSARQESGSHLSQSSLNREYKSESSHSLSSGPAQSQTASMAAHQHSLRFAKGLKLTVQHRIDLADKETDDMKKQYTEFEKITSKKRGMLHARLEEIKHRVTECRETAKIFDEEVVQKSDPMTKQIAIETFIKFIENQAQRVMGIVDKYNCKIVTAKRLIKLAKKQIEKREDVANILRPIDFEKLKIENKYIIRDNEWNHNHLNVLKLLSGHYNLVLKYRKEALLERKSTLLKIERNIETKKRHNVMLRHTQTIAAHEVKKALAQMHSIKELRDEYETPEVMDFLEVQKEMQEEKKKFARLNRQRKIQLFTLKLTRKAQQ